MDLRVVGALKAFVNAQSSGVAAAVFTRERAWLSLPEVARILSATIEGHRAQPGHARDLTIVQARWDLLDRLLEVGPEAALATFDATVEAVLDIVNAPADGPVVLDVDTARLASREADWVFADLLLQASDDETGEMILRRWQSTRRAARAGQLRQSPLAEPAAPAAAADPGDAAAATIARLEAMLAVPAGDHDDARRRDLRLDLSVAHLDCRSGDRAAHLRAAEAQLQRLQNELLANRLHAHDAIAREHLLRTYVNLGTTYKASADFALRVRGDGASALSLLDTAMQAYREAERLAGSEPVSQAFAIALHNGLGTLLSQRGERSQAVEHYAIALRVAREAGAAEDAALAEHNLGDELGQMETALPGARLMAVDHLRRALAFYTPAGWSSHRQQSLRSLGRVLFDLRDWQGAEDALSEAVALGRAEFQGAVDAGTVQRQVQDNAEVFSSSAFCLLRLGRVHDAVRRIEQGKARAAALRDGATAQADETGTLREGVPPGGAVVLTVMTAAGAAAIVIPDGGQHEAPGGKPTLTAAHISWLDRDSEKTLLDLAFGREGWLDNYFRYAPAGDLHWDAAIDRLAGALWPHYAGPIVDRLQALGVASGAEVAIVPWGRLAMLPLACAWRTVDGRRRYALEDFAFSQSPSLHLLARARRLAAEPRRQGRRLLAVANPGGDLPGALAESSRAAKVFIAHGAPEPILLQGGQATLAAVRAALPRCACWLFSCHGHFHWGRPELSALELAGAMPITLQALTEVRDSLPQVRLAVLTACESGLSDIVYAPDEFVGFPAALLGLGVPAVLGTLWPVDDSATAALLVRFFEYWLSERPKHSTAQSLRLAQLDFMEMPAAQFVASAPGEATMRDRLFYWGGLALTGT